MKINWDAVFFIVMVCILMVGFVYSITLVDNMIDNKKKANCLRVKISITNNILSDITRMDEHKQLCNNDNCTAYFDNKINKNNEYLGKFLDANCVEDVE